MNEDRRQTSIAGHAVSENERRRHSIESQVYQIRVKGHLDNSWSEWFEDLSITHEEDGWGKCMTTQFINRYVFPDGELDRVSNIQGVMEESCFEILHVEALRPHYALTLRHWVSRLEQRREEALSHTSESVYRVWRLYMAACAQAFEEGSLGVYQILAAPKRSNERPEKNAIARGVDLELPVSRQFASGPISI